MEQIKFFLGKKLSGGRWNRVDQNKNKGEIF